MDQQKTTQMKKNDKKIKNSVDNMKIRSFLKTAFINNKNAKSKLNKTI